MVNEVALNQNDNFNRQNNDFLMHLAHLSRYLSWQGRVALESGKLFAKFYPTKTAISFPILHPGHNI